MIKIAILGASTPIAGELIRLLMHHPDVELLQANSRSMASGAVSDVHSGLVGDTDLRFTPKLDLNGVDLLMMCSTPAETEEFLRDNELPDDLRVIDLSGATLDSEDFIYGLPELNRKAMVRGGKKASIPFAVATILNLALLPLAKNLMLNSSIWATVVTARGDRPDAPAFTGNDNVTVDRPLRHPQAEEAVRTLRTLQVSFEGPISLITMRGSQQRGTIATVVMDCATDLQHIRALYEDFYSDHNMVWILDRQVEMADVVNTNKCLIHLQKQDGKLIVTAALDNILKGGAGSAMHAMNLLFGLHERTGLELKTSTYN